MMQQEQNMVEFVVLFNVFELKMAIDILPVGLQCIRLPSYSMNFTV